MQDISLHLLDIIENSARAKATLISIQIEEDEVDDIFRIRVSDDGCGMDEQTLHMAQDPFYTSKMERVKKVGLGIPLFKQNVEQWNGHFQMTSSVGNGTVLTAEFQASHIDRIPLGNIKDTFLGSLMGHPEVNFELLLKHKTLEDEMTYEFRTADIKEELGEIPITYPDVFILIEQDIQQGILNTQMEEI